MIEKIIEEFKKINDVKAIAVAGSKGGGTNDSMSDFDVYIYSDVEIDTQIREDIAKKFSDRFEINNQFFETGDEWILRDGTTVIDIMYRNCRWIEEQIERVCKNHCAGVGYSTCFVYNVKNSEIYYDTEGWFKKLQEQIQEYPEELARNIVAKNLPLLKNKLVSSYYEQIEKALKRNDLISVNHRVSAFLASYFDILFAVNHLWHPGEKKLLKFALDNCRILPKDFEFDMQRLLTTDEKLKSLDNLNKNLIEII